MKRSTKIILGIIGALLVLAIIGGATKNQETSSVGAYDTPSVSLAQTPQKDDTLSPEPDSESLSPDAQLIGLQITWDKNPQSQKDTLCNGWNSLDAKDLLLDSFMQNAPGFDREVVREFFNTHC